MWGAIYASYPGLEIVHRAGKIHSNIDTLSRLVRTLTHQSPISDDSHMIKGVLPQNPLTTGEELTERAAQRVALVNSKTKRSQETHQEEDKVQTEQELQVERRRREHSRNPPGPEG